MDEQYRSAQKCQHVKKKCKSCGWVAQGEAQTACPQCGADLRCGNYPVAGYTRCKYHGGPNPAAGYYGAGSMTTGKNSQFQIVRLAAKYNEMMANGNVLSNRQTINLIDMRMMQLLERVDVGDAPERMAKLYAVWKEYSLARQDGRTEEAVALMRVMDDEFEKVYHDYNAWKQIFEAMDLRRKAVESEMKVLEKIGALITMEDAYQMGAKFLAAAMKVIGDDPAKLKEIQYEFVRLTGERSGRLYTEDDRDDRGGSEEGTGEEGPGDMDQEQVLHPRDET